MRVVFVGPSAPPVNGFSVVTDAVRAKLDGYFELKICITSGPLLEAFRACLGAIYSIIARRPAVAYVALSGGARQLLDLLVLLVARARGVRIVIHHHSFAYIDRRSALTWLCLGHDDRDVHVVLCECMGKRLREMYNIHQGASVVTVSNAAFVTWPVRSAALGRKKGECTTVGFLSNITREKGIFEFLEIVSQLNAMGQEVAALIAGPVAPDIEAEFVAGLKKMPNAKYVGPVYGDRKLEFYESLDVLIFPTLYKNEAEPVTVWEALSCGVSVVAYSRGCISDMLSGAETCNAVPPTLEQSRDRVILAAQNIRKLIAQSETLDLASMAREHYQRARSDALQTFNTLCAELKNA